MTTAKEVLNWLNANQNQAIAFNNGPDIQCVDLVNYVSQKFFGKAMFVGPVGAKDIWNLSFPSGWQKIPASQGSQPGDIFVSGPVPTNEYGHTGIIAEDNDNVYDENYAGRKYISRHTRVYIPNVIGFIRPPYSDGSNSNNNNDNQKGEEEMTQALLIYGNGIYYMVGDKIKMLTTPEAVELVKRAYKAQYGKDINAFSLSTAEGKGLGL